MPILDHSSLIDKVEELGHRKITTPFMRQATLSVLAGAFIALGGILSVVGGYGFPEFSSNPAIQKLVSGMLFPVGLFLIVMFGGELFTGNNAVLMPGCCRKRYGFIPVLYHWLVVWCFNFIGALAFTYLFVYLSGLTAKAPYHEAVTGIAEAKCHLSPLTAFLKGIAANWCVCLAVWIGLMVKTLPAKMIACWIPVGTFVVLGYEHSIANMFFIPAGIFEGADVTAGQMFGNLLPVTLGNIAGGALLVGTLFFGLHGRNEATQR